MAQLLVSTGSSLDITEMHQVFGHACEATVRKTAAHYGIGLTGSFGSQRDGSC
jgi:hypothetical protein